MRFLRLAVIVLIFSAPALAQVELPAPPKTVLAIDAGDLVLDLGESDGVRVGQLVELWRPMRVRHPVTNKLLTDRIKLGTVRLVEVRSVLSLARVEREFQRPPAPGDLVLVPRPIAVVVPTPRAVPPTTALAPAAPVAPSPSTRPAEPAKVVPAEPEVLAASFARIERLRPGTPQRFAIELDPHFVGALIHVRARGASSYRSLPMESIGARYWAATLPGDAIAAPAMEYFVEGVPKSGDPVAVVGRAASPVEADVEPRPIAGKSPGTLATMSVASEIASFDARHANDYVFQTEGSFGLRLADTGIRAVRSGFGVLRGKGGSLDELDRLRQPGRDVGLTYGWIETEVGITRTFGLIGRPIIGLRDGGVTGGAQGFFRIGNDLETNLVVGGEALGSVGLRGFVELAWRTIPRVPILLRSEVTNQPAGVGGDIGGRAIAQVGWDVVRGLSVDARGSYQGRTIVHSGPGAGGGVSYQW